MEPLRILMLCLTDDPLDPPGWERFGGGHLFVFDLGRYLVRLGWRVDYITRLNAPSKRMYEDLGPLSSITRANVGPTEDLTPLALHSYFEEIVAAVRQMDFLQNPYDVIHSHNWLSGAVARRLISAVPVRHIHSILSLGRTRLALGEEATEGDGVRDRLELDVFLNADVLLTVAPSERNDLHKLYPEVKHDRVAVVPYGVDPQHFYPRPECPEDFVLRQARRSSQRRD